MRGRAVPADNAVKIVPDRQIVTSSSMACTDARTINSPGHGVVRSSSGLHSAALCFAMWPVVARRQCDVRNYLPAPVWKSFC